MASVTSVRSRVDQENSQQTSLKNVAQGRSFGPAKSFQSNVKDPLATPRRALGDVGNTLKTPANLTKKASLLKTINNQQNLLQSKTPGAKKITRATPLGKGLSKGSLSIKTNKRQAFQVRGDVQSATKNRSSSLEKDCFKKEKMIPFIDEEKPLPRGPAINAILSNVSQLYKGCLQPVATSTFSLDSDPIDTSIETVERPETDKFFNWLACDNDFSDLTSNVSCSLDEFELPPVDTDLSGLGLP